MKVDYLNHMGDDLMVVNSARVSFDKESELEVIPDIDGPHDENNYPILLINQLSEADKKLIKYLAKNGHWSPFSHPQIQLRVTVPIFVANQLKRSVVGLAINEVSRRYVDSEPGIYYPDEWRMRPDKSLKQGSGGPLQDQASASYWYAKSVQMAENSYQNLLNLGVAPEMARMVLPQSTYTSWYWTGSLMAFLRIYKQRDDSHAQKESQFIAERLKEIIQPLFPVSWDAWFNREKE